MFALSPISGRLTDRFGSVKVILAGLVVDRIRGHPRRGRAPRMAASSCSSPCSCSGTAGTLASSPGSALLTRGLGLAERTRVQGLTDSLIWSSAAAASLGSGVVVAAASYTALGLLGAAMVVVPAWLLVSRRRAVDGCGRLKPAVTATSSRRSHAASTRAHASTSSSGTCSSALCATLTSPGPKITHGVPPTLTNRRMSAPYGSPSSAGRRPVTASAASARPTGSGWSDGTRAEPNRPPVISTVAGWSRRNSSAAQAAAMHARSSASASACVWPSRTP